MSQNTNKYKEFNPFNTSTSESKPFEDLWKTPESENTILLRQMNEKLDNLIATFGVPNVYIFTGKDVIAEFKKLQGVK